MGKYSKFRVIVALVLTILLVAVVISACNLGIDGEPPGPEPVRTGILAPTDQTRTLVGSPIQIQSAYPGDNLSRIELFVQGPAGSEEKLLRADVPTDGVVVQAWTPTEPGLYTIKTVAYAANNEAQPAQSIQIEVLDSLVVSAAAPQIIEEPSDQAAAFAPPPQVVEEAPTAEPPIRIVVIEPADMAPTATPPLLYPPPPPLPGIPKGPTQDQLPEKMPPVCDAAEYLGVFTTDQVDRRIFIPTDDLEAARVVGGSTVHRAWRLRNIGTCTWGPGYELAFYGGRAMGSGGVAFEAAYPADPGRTNALVNNERLIVPEGKPNQVAILEILLNIPPTPGIHQSYWRMRNPQGVWFGPIIGVTLEVVRDCKQIPGQPETFGAPVIDTFRVLGVGDVFRPITPTNVIADFGDTVTLEWNVVNATNFDVVLENPLGEISALSNTTIKGRAQFVAGELGDYTITIYADNGACAFTDEVKVRVIPRDQDLFELDIILSPTSAGAGANASNENIRSSESLELGNIQAEWQHIDTDVNQFILAANLQQRERTTDCSIFGYQKPSWLSWLPCQTTERWVTIGAQTQVDVSGAAVETGTGVQGSVAVSNIERNLCGGRNQNFRIVYKMLARQDGRPATPAESNEVAVICSGDTLRTEIP